MEAGKKASWWKLDTGNHFRWTEPYRTWRLIHKKEKRLQWPRLAGATVGTLLMFTVMALLGHNRNSPSWVALALVLPIASLVVGLLHQLYYFFPGPVIVTEQRLAWSKGGHPFNRHAELADILRVDLLQQEIDGRLHRILMLRLSHGRELAFGLTPKIDADRLIAFLRTRQARTPDPDQASAKPGSGAP